MTKKITTLEQRDQRAELLANIKAAKQATTDAHVALYGFDNKAENNVFASLEDAKYDLEDELGAEAFEDCQGAHNCGSPVYKREFLVDGVRYIGSLTVEYNRHDKMYYYVEESSYSQKLADPA